jgi:hypothetical protein
MHTSSIQNVRMPILIFMTKRQDKFFKKPLIRNPHKGSLNVNLKKVGSMLEMDQWFKNQFEMKVL